jgi:hypothetical protein
MIGQIPVSSFANTMKRQTITGLNKIIAGSTAVIATGLTGTAEQNEINRIHAATNELDRRGFYNDPIPTVQLKKGDNGFVMLMLLAAGFFLL